MKEYDGIGSLMMKLTTVFCLTLVAASKCDLFQREKCQSCFTYQYLLGDTCVACNLSCLSCINSQTCSSCIQGYFLHQNMQCMSCLSNCINCFNQQSCVKCIYPYTLNTNQTSCKNCMAGYFKQQSPAQKCIQCFHPCKSCQNQQTCLSCEKEDILSDGKCLSCFQGSYAENGTCKICQQNCISCNSSQHCYSCIKSYYVRQIHYDNKVSQFNQCKKCMLSCTMCESNNTCLSCQNGYYLLNEGNSSQCLRCDASCSICQNKEKCLQCQKAYYLKNNICKMVIQCQEGQYFSKKVERCIIKIKPYEFQIEPLPQYPEEEYETAGQVKTILIFTLLLITISIIIVILRRRYLKRSAERVEMYETTFQIDSSKEQTKVVQSGQNFTSRAEETQQEAHSEVE